MHDVLSVRSYWSSARGRTLASTLSSTLLRELQSNRAQARIVMTERGKIA